MGEWQLDKQVEDTIDLDSKSKYEEMENPKKDTPWKQVALKDKTLKKQRSNKRKRRTKLKRRRRRERYSQKTLSIKMN